MSRTVLTIEFTIASESREKAEDALRQLQIAKFGVINKRKRFAGVTIDEATDDISQEVEQPS